MNEGNEFPLTLEEQTNLAILLPGECAAIWAIADDKARNHVSMLLAHAIADFRNALDEQELKYIAGMFEYELENIFKNMQDVQSRARAILHRLVSLMRDELFKESAQYMI